MILYSKSDISIDVSQTLTTTDDYTVSDNIITLKTSCIIYELTGKYYSIFFLYIKIKYTNIGITFNYFSNYH